MFKMRCAIPNAYILDITMYKMHVSLCSYCTVRIFISKTLTGTREGGYTMYLRCVVIEHWILLYIVFSLREDPTQAITERTHATSYSRG